MKATFIVCLFLISATCFAQDSRKADPALLLDYYQTQRYADASAYLKSVYPEPVTDLKVIAQLAYTANMAGQLADAEVYYMRIFNADSTNTGVLFSLGSLNLRRGNNPKAEMYYKKISERDTTNFMVYKQLAVISREKSDMAGVINYLQKANKLNPAEPDVAADLSDLYVNIKFTARAEQVLNKAIAADPENITLLESLMKLTYAQKKWKETLEACLKLIKNGNDSPPVMVKLGVAYYNLKDFACGAETLAGIPKIGQNEFSYYYAAMCFKELKDHRQAVNLLQMAIDDGISPSIASYYGEIADSNEKTHRYKAAAAAYQKGLQFNDSPMIYYSLANLYDTQLKDKKNARKYFQKYLGTRPPADKQQQYIAYAKSRVEALSL